MHPLNAQGVEMHPLNAQGVEMHQLNAQGAEMHPPTAQGVEIQIIHGAEVQAEADQPQTHHVPVTTHPRMCCMQQRNSWGVSTEDAPKDDFIQAATLTPSDVKDHWAKVEQGIMKELSSWMEHKVLEQVAVDEVQNEVDTTWAYKWKGEEVKARWCLRGFKDHQKDHLNTAAFTASRTSQRMLTSLAALNQWPLVSLDISTAFLQGDTYGDSDGRMVCIKIPTWVLKYLRRFKQFEHYDPQVHGMRLRKPAYGLVDAPRKWYEVLRKELEHHGWRVSLSDPGLFYLRIGDSAQPQGYLTVHVDDLKATGSELILKRLQVQLTSRFGKLKSESGKFEHCGVMHEVETNSTTKAITYVMHQNHYLARVRLPQTEKIKEFRLKSDKQCSEEDHSTYRSLLGKLAWCVTTRPEGAVVCALLQGKANQPKYEDLIRLIVLAKWLKQHPAVTRYGPLEKPYRL
eukprot:6491717-Amphidinium_carterae.1